MQLKNTCKVPAIWGVWYSQRQIVFRLDSPAISTQPQHLFIRLTEPDNAI